MLDNKTVVETAAKVFEKYNLPDGVNQITGLHGERLFIGYVLGVYDVPDMEMIQQATNEFKRTTGNHFLIVHRTVIDGVPVEISAQIPQEAYVGG